MLTLCKNDKNKIKQMIHNKQLDFVAMSNSNFIDDVILAMSRNGIIDCLNNGFNDKRRHNSFVPFKLIMSMSIAEKMRVHSSLTDIPCAIQDHRVLQELGYNIISNNNKNGLFSEGTLRYLLGKYSNEDFISYYNNVTQNHVFPLKHIENNIHILDCTKIAVNFDNSNYEGSSIVKDRKGNDMRGYKLASLRGVYKNTGLIEEIRLFIIKLKLNYVIDEDRYYGEKIETFDELSSDLITIYNENVKGSKIEKTPLEIVLKYLRELPKGDSWYEEVTLEQIMNVFSEIDEEEERELCSSIEELVISLGEAELCYEMASNFDWVDKKVMAEIVINDGNPDINYYFASEVEGADIQRHKEVILNSKYTDDYILDRAKNL